MDGLGVFMPWGHVALRGVRPRWGRLGEVAWEENEGEKGRASGPAPRGGAL